MLTDFVEQHPDLGVTVTAAASSSPSQPTERVMRMSTEHAPTGPLAPDLRILEERVYRGGNVWSYDPAIHLVMDLGVLEGLSDRHDPRIHRPAHRDAAGCREPQLLPRPRG